MLFNFLNYYFVNNNNKKKQEITTTNNFHSFLQFFSIKKETKKQFINILTYTKKKKVIKKGKIFTKRKRKKTQ